MTNSENKNQAGLSVEQKHYPATADQLHIVSLTTVHYNAN